jgi:hypothetical protein
MLSADAGPERLADLLAGLWLPPGGCRACCHLELGRPKSAVPGWECVNQAGRGGCVPPALSRAPRAGQDTPVQWPSGNAGPPRPVNPRGLALEPSIR